MKKAYPANRISYRVETPISKWRLCWLLLISSVAIETIFILASGLHYYRYQLGDRVWIESNPYNGTDLVSTTPASGSKTTPGNKSKEFDPSPTEFLKAYEKWCMMRHPKTTKVKGQPDCDCVSSHLTGPINVTFEMPPFGEMELSHPELSPGGHWKPAKCTPRQRVVIIVPFRDREEHLRIFLNILHPMLQRQELDYRIVIIEQAAPDIFNKAMMMNIGFKEATRMFQPDCVIFHDVDMIPEDDRNMYVCSDQPRHVGSHCDKFKYIVPYPGIFGGATAFKPEHFELINGFSNSYFGWGGEDDDMYRRVIAKRLKIVRFPGSVARYKMIKHKSDKRNPYNRNSGVAWGYRPSQYMRDGLNTLKYKRRSLELRPLYTWIYAEVEPPKNFNRPKGRGRSAKHINSQCALDSHLLVLLVCLVLAFRTVH